MTNRRETVWIDTLHENNITSGGAFITSLNAPWTAEEVRRGGLTLLRTIICHDYGYTIHDSGEGNQIIDVGIGVFSNEAFGASALPDPDLATDFPAKGWVYRCRHKLAGFDADQPAVDIRTVYRDLRSRRKIENGILALHIMNKNGNGVASTIQVAGITRCLFMLS